MKLERGVKSRLTLDAHQVVLRPLITEKGTHQSTRYNSYTFQVSRLATKDDVRRAVEEMFEVKVTKVRIQNRRGKPRRVRFRHATTSDWKKAIVTLHAEHRIDFF